MPKKTKITIEREKMSVKNTERVTLTLREAAQASGLSLHYLYKLSASNRLPVLRIGGRRMFLKDDFVAWLKSHRIQGES